MCNAQCKLLFTNSVVQGASRSAVQQTLRVSERENDVKQNTKQLHKILYVVECLEFCRHTLFDRLTKSFHGFQNNTHTLHSDFANLLTLLRSGMLLLTGSKKSNQPTEFHWIYSKLCPLDRLSSSFIITRKVSDRKTEALTHFMLFI